MQCPCAPPELPQPSLAPGPQPWPSRGTWAGAPCLRCVPAHVAGGRRWGQPSPQGPRGRWAPEPHLCTRRLRSPEPLPHQGPCRPDLGFCLGKGARPGPLSDGREALFSLSPLSVPPPHLSGSRQRSEGSGSAQRTRLLLSLISERPGPRAWVGERVGTGPPLCCVCARVRACVCVLLCVLPSPGRSCWEALPVPAPAPHLRLHPSVPLCTPPLSGPTRPPPRWFLAESVSPS